MNLVKLYLDVGRLACSVLVEPLRYREIWKKLYGIFNKQTRAHGVGRGLYSLPYHLEP